MPDDYYVCVGLVAVLLPCLLALLSLWAPRARKGAAHSARGRAPQPKHKTT